MTWRLWWPYANKIIQRQSSSRHGWFKRDRSSCDEFSIINTAAAPTIPLHKTGDTTTKTSPSERLWSSNEGFPTSPARHREPLSLAGGTARPADSQAYRRNLLAL